MQGQRNWQFDDQSKQVVSFTLVREFSKGRKHSAVFLSSNRNTCENLGELQKPVETLACQLCSYNIPHSVNKGTQLHYSTSITE